MYAGFWDFDLESEASRLKVAEHFVEDAIMFGTDMSTYQFVREDVLSRALQHELILDEFNNGTPSEEDAVLRSFQREGSMRAIAGYTQLADIADMGIGPLVAAFEDEALIFQGRA